MIQFEVGKTYETIHTDTSIIICARSKHFVTFKVIRPGAPDRTLRKKISVCLLTNKESWEYIRTNGLCHVWCNAQDLADSQPEASQHEKPQTCSIPDTTNITPADDTQEDTQNAQPEIVKFVVGKTYYETRVNHILNGKHCFLVCAYTVIKRTSATVTISETSINQYCATVQKTSRRKIRVIDGVEHITPHGSYFPGHTILPANAPTVKPNFLLTDSAQQESSQPDTESDSMPAAVANNESEATAQPEALPAKILAAKDIARLEMLESLPRPVLANFAHNERIDTDGIPTDKMPAYVSRVLADRLMNISRGVEITDGGIAVQTPLLTLFRNTQGYIPANIRFRVACYYYGYDNNGTKYVVSIDNRQPKTVCASIWGDGKIKSTLNFAVSVIDGVESFTFSIFRFPGSNANIEFTVSATDIEPDYNDPDYPGYIPAFHSELRYEDYLKKGFVPPIFANAPTIEPELPTTQPAESAQPATTDNIGFTVIPHDRMHIERPEYTVYPDTITDECPYTVIPACDIPAHNPAAAVVPYADARNIRNFFHILAIYIRMWLAINIHKRDIAIPMPSVFPPVIIPAAVKDITPQPAPQKLDRLWLFADDMKDYNMIRRKNKSLIDACDSEEAITALMLTLDTTDILNQANYCRVHLCTGIPHSSDHKSDEQLAREFAAVIMKRRAKKLKASQPKTQQKPEKKEPAPASAPELNGKLIDTANLHGNDWRNAHRHNISVITSCLFREAVTALLLKVSVSTIREIGGQLGTLNKHVKGNKSQLIARFVDRLFEIRSIRNKKTVTTTTTPHNATSTQHKGFKIVQLKNRQLGFIFSE